MTLATQDFVDLHIVLAWLINDLGQQCKMMHIGEKKSVANPPDTIIK